MFCLSECFSLEQVHYKQKAICIEVRHLASTSFRNCVLLQRVLVRKGNLLYIFIWMNVFVSVRVIISSFCAKCFCYLEVMHIFGSFFITSLLFHQANKALDLKESELGEKRGWGTCSRLK